VYFLCQEDMFYLLSRKKTRVKRYYKKRHETFFNIKTFRERRSEGSGRVIASELSSRLESELQDKDSKSFGRTEVKEEVSHSRTKPKWKMIHSLFPAWLQKDRSLHCSWLQVKMSRTTTSLYTNLFSRVSLYWLWSDSSHSQRRLCEPCLYLSRKNSTTLLDLKQGFQCKLLLFEMTRPF
jgi:hypothetical protein